MVGIIFQIQKKCGFCPEDERLFGHCSRRCYFWNRGFGSDLSFKSDVCVCFFSVVKIFFHSWRRDEISQRRIEEMTKIIKNILLLKPHKTLYLFYSISFSFFFFFSTENQQKINYTYSEVFEHQSTTKNSSGDNDNRRRIYKWECVKEKYFSSGRSGRQDNEVE